jgi:hypothetical protein
MADYSMYRFFRGEDESPFDKVNQNTQHMFWFYESCFERQFADNGGFEKNKAAIFDHWLNDYLFVEKLYDEYSGGKTSWYKEQYYSFETA